MVSAGMTEHLKRLSADTDEVILATCALAAARAGRAPVAGGGDVPVGSAASTRELEKELAAAKEELRGHEGSVAEWLRKVASARNANSLRPACGRRECELSAVDFWVATIPAGPRAPEGAAPCLGDSAAQPLVVQSEPDQPR
jgi:hypothetical protein